MSFVDWQTFVFGATAGQRFCSEKEAGSLGDARYSSAPRHMKIAPKQSQQEWKGCHGMMDVIVSRNVKLNNNNAFVMSL